MLKNVSGQKIGAQLVSATDGSAFTGSVTVYVTGDAGTQAAGSVGSGACTHEGGGFHTYAPAQAETNYDHVAFTFSGTGAVPVTVQVYTAFPQTGDAFARLGAPAGASIAADIATVDDFLDTEVGAIKAKTDSLTFTVAGHVDANVLKVAGQDATVIPEPAALGTTTGTPTTTSVIGTGSELSGSDDVYNNAFLVPTSGALKGVAREITDYVGSSKTFTVDAFPAAPASGVTFMVVGRKETA